MTITKIMLKSFLVNLILGILKLVGGLLSNSKTLVADAIHCLSDMSTDIVGIIGSKLANKKPDKQHPFGHGKIEYVTSIFISALIIVLGITIFKRSFEEKSTFASWYALIVLVITIIVKIILFRYLIKKGKTTGNTILITNGTESKYDVYASSVSLIFVLLSVFSGEVKVFRYADTIGSIFISILTISVGLTLFIKNVNSVIGEVNDDANITDLIKNIILKNNDIKKIVRVTIMKSGNYNEAIIDLEMDETTKLKYLYLTETLLKQTIKKEIESIKYVTINIKPYMNKKST